ncbi:DNA methyltransferase [Helicobacter pylori]|uniref:DNA methyltransferase n=2 Tax=Helicobacter pylori TaxID=210 RepID=UPI0013F49A01|nr:DNA methyltransferase [Helicobacter pylori]NHA49582.1 site-specific DNA-methyltransferase [Helicobacter pylori]
MKTNEAQFYEVLENLFIGVKIEDQPESLLDPTPRAVKNGMINLMKAKSQYYHHKKQELKKLIDSKCQDNNDLKEELFDKLYSFFKRYFSANGGIYFNDTPLYDNLYTKSGYEKSENYQALNSLKNRYKEAIDCIYIDPPYNTQNNEFVYADNFKRSSWLSMMENRLELAHALLNDKGVMFVSIDDNEQAYCKALMDGVFNGGGGGITL